MLCMENYCYRIFYLSTAAFTERLSSGLPETQFHECNLPERVLQICEDVTLKNYYCKIHECRFIEGKMVEKKKKFHLRQTTKNGSKNFVLHLCKCPIEPSVYIQDNVYSNDVTVFIDVSQVSN